MPFHTPIFQFKFLLPHVINILVDLSGWHHLCVLFFNVLTYLLCCAFLPSGKGRGRQVIAVARTADLVIIMLDATKSDKQRYGSKYAFSTDVHLIC